MSGYTTESPKIFPLSTVKKKKLIFNQLFTEKVHFCVITYQIHGWK